MDNQDNKINQNSQSESGTGGDRPTSTSSPDSSVPQQPPQQPTQQPQQPSIQQPFQAPSQQPPIQATAAPQEKAPEVEDIASVVVPTQDKGLPKWFYFFFIIVVVVFVSITTLLVLTLLNQQKTGRSDLLTSSDNQETQNNLLPTAVSNPTPDSAVVDFQNVSEKDDIQSIDDDLANTDFSSLRHSLNTLDELMGVSLE